MYIIGFCDSVLDMLHQYVPHFDGITGSRINDVRLIGSITLFVILCLGIIGMSWVTRAQLFFLIILIASQFDVVIGSFIEKDESEKAKGMIGYNAAVFNQNIWPKYHDKEYPENQEKSPTFFSVFAVFFPAVTGIVAGANLSGDLKNPGEAIPKGTLLAIATTFVTYVIHGLKHKGRGYSE
jgi:amino acid transporter